VWLAIGIFVTGFCVSGSQVCANVIASAYYPTSNRATGVAWALGIGRVGAVAGSLGGAFLLAAGWSNAGLFMILAIPAALAGLGIWLAGAKRARAVEVADVAAGGAPADLAAKSV